MSDKKDRNPASTKSSRAPKSLNIRLVSHSNNHQRIPSKMGLKLFSTGRLHRRQSRSAARSMANDDEAHAAGGAAGEFESTASLSSSGRNNPSAFNGVPPNANSSTSFRAIQLQQMDLLMTAIQKLSDAVDSNTSAIRDMQLQNNQVREFVPSQQLRTSPTNEHNARSEPQQQKQAFDIFIPSPSSDQRSSSSDSCSSSSSSSGVSDEGLERKQTRLDGLEVYAVVSAVTAGTLVAVFDSYHPGDILDLFSSGRWLELCLSLLFTATGAFGIVCGLHCIFVFSLITMYGRTALGMERDDALEIFFSGTGLQRYHGFKTFVASLYSLGTCLLVVIASKISSNPTIHLLALMVSAKLMHYVYRDTQDIMSKATVIFAPPTAPSPSISSSYKIDESAVMEVEEALDLDDVQNFAEEENTCNAQQQMIASTNDHPSLPRNDEKRDLPQDDATKSQSATTETSSKKDKQNRSRRRRSSLGLSAADHIAMEEQKCTATTKKRASAMTLSAADLMGANVGISRFSSISPDQKTKRGKAATTRSADAIENSDHGKKIDVEESTGNAVRHTVESTCNNIQDLVQQKRFRSVWRAAAREAVATSTATNNVEGTNQNRKETDRSDDDNSDTDDGSDNSADVRQLANLLASKQEGWQQQAWLQTLTLAKAAAHHNHHRHHHGQHHGKRHSSAMNQSAMDHIKMDAPGALHVSTMNLFGEVHGRRASNSSRAPSA